MLSEIHAFLEMFVDWGLIKKDVPWIVFELLPFSDIFMVFSKS